MKKILIVKNNMTTGGITTALINLLHEIADLKEYEVTLFLFSKHGESMSEIPPNIIVIEAKQFLQLMGLSQKESRAKGFFLYIIRAVLATFTRVFGDSIPYKLLIATEQHLRNFDVVISYTQSAPQKSFYGGCNEFVLEKVDAKQKIAFIHCDFIKYGLNTEYSKKVYSKFDKIATVSHGSMVAFLEAIPKLTAKTYCVHNCQNYTGILHDAEKDPVEYPSNTFNIITVSRLGLEKGHSRAINAMKDLINEGAIFFWHIVGDGVERANIEKLIKDYQLQDYIMLHGNQYNPHRWMKNADLFLLPSFHEAAPMVFGEAKCLGIPILTTRTTSALEMVQECDAGFVCENSEAGIYYGLKELVFDKEKVFSCKDKMKARGSGSNQIAISEFIELINIP